MRGREGQAGRTLLQRLQTLESDLKFVLVGKLGGVVDHIDPEEGNDRHLCGSGSGRPAKLCCMTVNNQESVGNCSLQKSGCRDEVWLGCQLDGRRDVQWLLRQEKAVFEWKALGKIAVFVLAAFPLQNETRRFEGSVGDSLASGRTFWGLLLVEVPSRSGGVQGVESRKLNAAQNASLAPDFQRPGPTWRISRLAKKCGWVWTWCLCSLT